MIFVQRWRHQLSVTSANNSYDANSCFIIYATKSLWISIAWQRYSFSLNAHSVRAKRKFYSADLGIMQVDDFWFSFILIDYDCILIVLNVFWVIGMATEPKFIAFLFFSKNQYWRFSWNLDLLLFDIANLRRTFKKSSSSWERGWVQETWSPCQRHVISDKT